MKTKTILSQVTARTAHGARLATLLLAAVAAGRAWAIVADDVWELESGLPTSGTQEGANGNYTLTAAGNSTLGATIDLSGVSSLAKVSVLVKYSGLSAQSSGYYTLATVSAKQDSSASNTIGWRNSAENAVTATGYYVDSSLNAYRFDTYSDSSYTYSSGTEPELPESGYFLFTHDISASAYSGTYGTALYAASSLSSLAGGVNRQLKWARDTNSARCITTLSVGGPVAVSSTEAAAVSAWPDVTIEKVALFVGQTLTPSDVANYVFPSEQDYSTTISESTGWDAITWSKAWVADSDATVAVSANATLTIPDTASIGTLNLAIANGVTLTLANSGTISAIAATGGTLKFSDTATIPAISGTAALELDDNAIITAGGALTHTGGTTMGACATLNTTAAYGFGTGAFTSADTTAEVKYVGGGTGTTTLSSAATQFGGATWTGAVRLSATTNGYIYVNQWGNSNSKIIMDGVRCYPAVYTVDSTDAYKSYNVREIEVADGGWKLYGTFNNRKVVIPAKLTGVGSFQAEATGSTRIFLTGDISEFSGDLRVSGSKNPQFQILRTSSVSDDPVSDSNCIAFAAGTIAVAAGSEATVAGTWWAAGGFIVNGTLNVNSKLMQWTDADGFLTSGSGTVNLASLSLENSVSAFATASAWTGSVVIPSFTATEATSIHFNYLGNENSTVVLKGISDNNFTYYVAPAEYGSTVNPTVQIDGAVYFNGTSLSTTTTTTFRRVTGGSSGGFYTRRMNWHITTLTNYTGAVGALVRTDNQASSISIGTIALASDTTVSVGNKLVTIDKAWTNVTDYASTVVTIGGTATALKVAKNGTYANDDVGLYVAGVATDGTTSYATVGDAVAAAGETEGTISVSASTENETLDVDGDITLTLADEVTLTVASLSGEGTLTVNVADGYSTGATIVIPKAATIGNITLGDGVTLFVDGEIASGDTLFTLTGDSATSFETVSCVYGTIHVTDTDGVITAGRTYYWIGTSSDSNNTPITSSEKWSYSDGGAAVGDSTTPDLFDTAIFNVSGSGAKLQANIPYNIEVRANFTFYNNSSIDYNIGMTSAGTATGAAFTIADGVTATLASRNGKKINLYSTLSGNTTSTLTAAASTNAYSCVDFYGDTSGFCGTVNAILWGSNLDTYIRLQNAASINNANSSWNIFTTGDKAANSNRDPFQASGTYYFGALALKANGYAAGKTIVVGGRGEDSSLTGNFASAATTVVTWTDSTATLSQGATNLGTLNLTGGGYANITVAPASINFTSDGGYLTIDDDNASSVAAIANAISTASAAVGFNVTAEDAVSATVTASALLSNCSFNKKGSGTLTLTGAFTSLGTINVSEGTLVVKTTTQLTKDATENGYVLGTAKCTETTEDEGATYVYTFTLAGVEVEVDDGTTVRVPATWLETYDLTSATASDLTDDRSDGNGYSYFACYALNLDPTAADSVPLATITSDSDGNFVVGLTGCGTIPDNVSITLSLISTTDIDDDFAASTPTSTSGSGIDTTFTITPSTVSSGEFFKVKITIGSAE